MLNPLGPLPGDTSQQFRVSNLDWIKILRLLLIQLAGLFVTYAPALMGYHYVVMGQDITPVVMIVISTTLELARRFLAGYKQN